MSKGWNAFRLYAHRHIFFGSLCQVEQMNEYVRKYKALKFYTRSVALGAIKNWMAALLMGSGKYVMTLNDRDTIETDNLNDLVGILSSNNDIVAGYCDPFLHDNSIKYYEGIEILFKVAYRSLHPSGYFFERDKLSELPCMHENLKYLTKENVGYWPHDFAMAECFDKGRVLFYKRRLVVKSNDEYIATHRSGVDASSVENIWFSPKQRFVQLTRIIKHIQMLKICKIDRWFLINKVIYRQLRYATVIYASYRENKYESLHYGLETKKISRKEMQKIVTDFKNECIDYLNLAHFDWTYKVTSKIICDCYRFVLVVKGLS